MILALGSYKIILERFNTINFLTRSMLNSRSLIRGAVHCATSKESDKTHKTVLVTVRNLLH